MQDAIKALAELRQELPALKLLLLPDALWEEFKAYHEHLDEASHESMVLAALEGGHLDSITGPIERFLFDEGAIRPEVPVEYVNGLQERWVLAKGPLKRHQESKIFRGFLAELQVACWLEHEGAEVTGLAALGAPSDIEFKDSRGRTCTMEVKHIGQDDAAFNAMMRSATRVGSRTYTPGTHDSADFFLLRAFHAAEQLDGVLGRRVVCLVLSAAAVDLYEFLRKLRLVDWEQPKLWLREETEAMSEMLRPIESRHPDLVNELPARIRAMTEVWVLSFDHRFSLSCLERVRPTAPD